VTVADTRAYRLSASGRSVSLTENNVSSLSLVGIRGMENLSLVRNTVRVSFSVEQSADLTFEDRRFTRRASIIGSEGIRFRNLTAGSVEVSNSNDSVVSDVTVDAGTDYYQSDRVDLESSSNVTVRDVTAAGIALESSSNNTVSNATVDTVDLWSSPDNTVRNTSAERISLSSASDNPGYTGEIFSDNNTVAGNTADIIQVVEDSRNNTIRDNDAAVLVTGDTTYDNLVVGNDASNHTVGIEIDGASRTVVENNTVRNATRGIVLRGATGNPLVNNTAVDSSEWDYFATNASTDNPVTDLTVGPTVSFDSRDVAIKKATDPPAPPSGKAGIGAFLVVNDTGVDAWADLTVQYTDADASGVDEESLRLWRYADGSWAPIGEDERLDTTENRVSANVSGENFGIVAPLGDATGTGPEPPQNTAPTITAIPDQAVAEGDSREVAVSAADADGDALSLSLAQAPDFVTLDDNGDGTGTITIDPATGDNGTYAVAVVADDGTATATEGFNLTVVDGETTHTVELIGGGTYTEYDLTVSGEVTGGAGLNPVDSFSGSSASGTIIAGSDTYVFTGELTSVSIDDSATVEVDGEVVDPATLGQTEIEIVGSGEYTEYEFDVSGEVTGGAGLNAADSFSGASASGTVIGGSDTYTFTGEVRNLSVDGSATVRIRGEE
jgi:parallel beta-helix repeat protein